MTARFYLPKGPEAPDVDALEVAFAAAQAVSADRDWSAGYDVRCVGKSADICDQVLDLIIRGEKTGTFSMQWLIERTGRPTPTPGLALIFIDFAGTPRVITQLTAKVERVAFGDVGPKHTALDGPAVRDLSVWRPLHQDYWGQDLAPFGLTVDDAMPVWIEPFDLVWTATP